MNKLLPIAEKNASLTMSSREIAGLCEKRHDHVMVDIRNMLNELKIQSPEFSGDYIDSKGRTYPCFYLPKDLTLTLIAGYNVILRKRIIDRWQELEAKQTERLPQSFSEALLLAAQLQAEKEQNAPKVEAFDRLVTATEGSMNLTNAAKHLQMQPKAFNQFLFSKNWIYKRMAGSPWIAYQDKLKSGYLEHKAHSVKLEDGSEKICPQVLVTAKGLAKLSSMLNKGAQDV